MAEASATALGRLSLPARDARPVPGVVFIHDVWGPSPHSEQFSDRLADAGHAVLAVDFYRDLGTRPGADPGAFIRSLDDTRVLADVAAAISVLADLPECAGAKVGVTGVCMGGMYALLAACAVDGLAAAAPFYGMLSYDTGMLADPAGRDLARKPKSPLEAAPSLRCPLLAFFGEADAFIPSSDVDALAGALPVDRMPVEIVRYPGVGHAFMNETRPAAFNARAASDAWARLEAFFARHLA